jgi:hypothetical protein
VIARLAPVAAWAAQLLAALLTLGPPDPARGLAFLASGAPTAAESLAALQLLVWALIAGAATVGLAGLALEANARRVRRRMWECSVVGVGLLLLAGGAARHLTYEPSLSGGSVQEARRVLGP